MPIPRHSTRILVSLALAGLLQACGGPSAEELIASAKTYIAQNDRKAAVIQLKSALQRNPDSAEGRYLLGKLLLETGDPVAATVELRKAEALGYDKEQLALVLATAWLRQGEDRKLTDTYGSLTLKDPTANAQLKTALGLAYARQDKPEAAAKAVAEALASAPDYAPAKFQQARVAATKRDFPTAMALLDGITRLDPKNAEAWLLKGELQQYGLLDDAAALSSFRKAVELRNDLLVAHQGLVGLLVKSGQLDAAAAHVEQLKKTLPNQPATQLLDANMAFLKKDYARTRTITQALLQAMPNNPMVLQLAGAAEYQLGALAPAENLLAQSLKYAPGLPLASQLLGRTYLRTGQPEKAIETVRAATEGAQPQAEALTVAGQAYLQLGDARRAEDMFVKAGKVRPDDPRIRTALALGHIGKGGAAAGLSELQAVSAADSGISADLALVAAQIQRKDFDKALAAIASIERKQPDRPLAAHLRGRVLALRQDAAGARKSFERALVIDPAYFPAVMGLAALDRADNKPEAARKRFEDLLRTDPNNTRAMIALADVMARSGASQADIEALLARAVKAAPGDATPRLQLVNFQLAGGRAKAALTAAQESVTAVPQSRELLQALGRAQLASGDHQQAITTFSKLATLQPTSPLPSLGPAEAHQGLKDYEAAERDLKKALEIAPNLVIAQRALLGLMATDGRYADALAVARQVQKQRPDEAIGSELEGEIELSRRNWDSAIAAFRAALARSKAPESAMKLHHALQTAGRADEAERFSTVWQKEHARDAAFRFYLGDTAFARKDWPAAEERYREVLRVQPDNPMALNNVAWLLLKQAKPGALPFAEKAIAQQPEQPALLDTLALALAADRQLPRALETQRKAIDRAPDAPGLRLTLARLYLQSGDKAQARTELQKLTALGAKFAEQGEVAELLKSI